MYVLTLYDVTKIQLSLFNLANMSKCVQYNRLLQIRRVTTTEQEI